jgi:hypothetical protein
MRKFFGFGVVMTSALAIWACSSSSPNNGGGGNSDDSGTSSSSGGDDASGSSSGGGDATAMCSQSNITQMAGALGIDGGLDGGATGQCIMDMCKDEIDACMHETCAQCQQPIISCATSKCIMLPDVYIPKPPADASACDAPGPACHALGACCSQVSAAAGFVPALASYATTCTTNSASCDENTCRGTAAAINTLGMGFLTCNVPDGG